MCIDYKYGTLQSTLLRVEARGNPRGKFKSYQDPEMWYRGLVSLVDGTLGGCVGGGGGGVHTILQ